MEQRQGDDKGRAFTRGGLHGDGSLVLFDERLGNRQTQAGTAATGAVSGGVGAVEAVEDTRRVLFGHALAVVRDLEHDAVKVLAQSNHHVHLGPAVFESVVDQVHQYLVEAVRVAVDFRGTQALIIHFDGALGVRRPCRGDGRVDNLLHLHGLPVQAGALRAGECQQVFDQQLHAAGFLFDLVNDHVRIGSHPLAVELGVAANTGQRRAQLVGGVADKAAHLLLFRLRVVDGFLQLRDHGVDRVRQLAHFGLPRPRGHTPIYVAVGNGQGGVFHLAQRRQRAPHQRTRGQGDADHRGKSQGRFHHCEPAQDALLGFESLGHQRDGAVVAFRRQRPPLHQLLRTIHVLGVDRLRRVQHRELFPVRRVTARSVAGEGVRVAGEPRGLGELAGHADRRDPGTLPRPGVDPLFELLVHALRQDAAHEEVDRGEAQQNAKRCHEDHHGDELLLQRLTRLVV